MLRLLLAWGLNHRLWMVAGAVVAVAVLMSIWWFLKPSTSPLKTVEIPAAEQRLSWILPGQTSIDEAIKRLGPESAHYPYQGYEVYTFATNASTYLPDQLWVKDKTIVLAQIAINPLQYHYDQSLFELYHGKESALLYDNQNVVKIYPQQGLAGYIRPDKSAVVTVKRFQPMSLKDFLQTWGQGLTDTKAPIKPIEGN